MSLTYLTANRMVELGKKKSFNVASSVTLTLVTCRSCSVTYVRLIYFPLEEKKEEKINRTKIIWFCNQIPNTCICDLKATAYHCHGVTMSSDHFNSGILFSVVQNLTVSHDLNFFNFHCTNYFPAA